jgi:hypothetical protein
MAQVTEGSIAGSVMDQSGAAVAKAHVVAKNISTGVTRETITDGAGGYRIGFLQPGDYTVSVTETGFGVASVSGITVVPSVVSRADVNLAVQSSESVDVSGSGAHVDTEEGRLTTTLTQQQVEDLPTAGREVYSLALLQPGVTATLAPVISDTESNTFNSGFSANGATPRGNNYVLDGVSNNNEWLGGTPAIAPSVESIEDFQVQTANFSPEYGRNNGAIVIATTRAGTNKFHGSIYDYIRNPVFDAGNEFDQPGAKSKVHRNDFGVSFGGPIVKDKAFFFLNYEGVQEADATTLIGTGETPAYRAQVALYRPTSIANQQFQLHPSGPCVPGTITNPGSIYGKTVPLATIQAFTLGQWFFDGAPETSADESAPIGDTCETAYLYKKPVTSNQYMARVDYHFSGKDTFFVRFIQDTHATDTASEELGSAAGRGFRAPLSGKFPSVLISEIHVFTPNLLNDLRIVYAREDFGIGFEAPNSGVATYNYPNLFFDNGFNGFGGDDFVPRNFVFNNFTYADTLSWQHGRHAIKIGAEIQRLDENSDYKSDTTGYYEFQDQFTFGNDGAYFQTAAINPVTGQFTSTPRHFRQNWLAGFIADDWHVTQRLALNLGVRYDLYGVATERDGYLSNITFGSGTTFGDQLANATVGRVYHLLQGDHNNFSPRIGFAYDLTGSGKTAIRGSIAQAYLAPYSNLYTNASRFDSPDTVYPYVFPYYGYGTEITYGVPAQLNPAYSSGLTAQGGLNGGPISISGTQNNLRNAYSDQFFLGVQHEFPGRYFLTANYVGTMGKKLYIRDDINRYTGSRTDNGNAAARYNSEWSATTYVENGPGSNYNGVNLQLQHPLVKHYSLTVNYTYGKALDTVSDPGLADYQNVSVPQYIGTMDEQKPRLDYGPSDFDARHRFTAFGSWMVPSPEGNALVRTVLGGWQLNGVLALQSGRPFSVVCVSTLYCDYNGDGDGYDRPNTPSYGNIKRGLSRSDYIKGDFIHASDFLDPNNGLTYAAEFGSLAGISEGKNGNLGRNTFRGPGYADVDASIFKAFALSQHYKLQFRAEAFNLFNRVNLFLPNTSLTSGPTVTGLTKTQEQLYLFGRSTAAFSGRNMQFAFKLTF